MIDKMAILSPFVLELMMTCELLIAIAAVMLIIGKKLLFKVILACILGILTGILLINVWGV